MSNQKYLTISLTLKKGNKLVGCNINVRDEYVILSSTDDFLPKQLYELESKQGKCVAYNKELNAFSQKYKGKTKEEILEILKADFKRVGASEIKIGEKQ